MKWLSFPLCSVVEYEPKISMEFNLQFTLELRALQDQN